MQENGSAGEYTWQIQVRSSAHLDEWLRDCFAGLRISHESDGTSLITGELPDLPAVYGFILQLRDGGIGLLSMQLWRE